MKLSRLLCLGLAAGSGFLTACVSQEKTAAAQPAAAKEEYVTYTPTGSWMSKKVKKSQVTPTDQESAEAKQAMEELQRRANQVPKDH